MSQSDLSDGTESHSQGCGGFASVIGGGAGGAIGGGGGGGVKAGMVGGGGGLEAAGGIFVSVRGAGGL